MSHLSAHLLGTLEIHLDDHPVTAFEYDKVRALLAYLMVESDHPHRRESLAGLLWPEHTERAARQNLSQALLVLRRAITDREVSPPFLNITAQTLQFNTTSDSALDVSLFTTLTDGVQQHQHTDLFTCNACLLHLDRAVSLYQGDFLAGFSLPDCPEFEIWLTLQRERLQKKALDTLGHLAQAYLQCGELEIAVGFAQRQLVLDNWHEPAYRQMMVALALSGQRNAALAQYEVCVQVLRSELDVSPEPVTTELNERIRAAELTGEADIYLALDIDTLAPTPGEPPFRGLDFYDVGDADLFFGRETLTANLIAHVESGDRFLAVVGASGSGKSSLVRAGLAARLRRQAGWVVCVLTPGTHPLQALESAMASGPPALSSHQPGPDVQHLIVVDQFEELFTLCRNPGVRQAYVDRLLGMAGDKNSAEYVVIALRADFYHHCARFDALRVMLERNQVYIGSMTADELREAIEAPVHRNGWTFEPGLVDTILRDIGVHAAHPLEPGSLPLLSHALLETWRRRQGRTLVLSGYIGAGGVQRAIAHTAEAIYQSLAPEMQTIARHIFVRLTELGEGTQDTRRRADWQELASLHTRPGAVETLLGRLTESRLVSADAQTVQVTHEALIREWPTLRIWLEQDRESLHLHRHLTESARAWENLGRDPGELYRGARLAQAIEWTAEHGGAINALEQTFLEAAQTQEARAETEREARRQRELKAAQALATAERQRAAERGRMLRWIGLVAVLLLVVAIVAVLLGNQARLAAQENADLADDNAAIAATAEAARKLEAEQRAAAELAQQEKAEQLAATEAAEHDALIQASVGLAARALDELDGVSPERAVLLAIAALEEYPYTPQAESALARSVRANRAYSNLTDSGGSRYHQRVAWSPDGRHIAAGQYLQEDVAVIWDPKTADIARRLPWNEELAQQCTGVGLAWSPTGDRVVIATYHSTLAACRTLQVWDSETGDVLLSLPTSYPDLTLGVDWSPDGNRVLGYTSEGLARIWDISPGNSTAVTMTETFSFTITAEAFHISPGSKGKVAWSPDGERLVTVVAQDAVARIWDAATGREGLALAGHTSGLTDAAWSPDGSRLATASMDGNVRVWETTSGEVTLTLAGHSGGQSRAGVQAVAWSPDGTRIATAGGDRTVRVWYADSGAEILRYYGITNPWDVDWSPTGDRLVIRGAEEIRILDMTAEPLRLLNPGETREIIEAQYSPDGTRIATSADQSNIVRIWDAATGTMLLKLEAKEPQRHLAWSPKGRYLATGGNPLHVWDTVTGELRLAIPTAPQAWYHTVHWTPDGTRILGSSAYVGSWPVDVFDAMTGLKLLTFGDYGGFKVAEWSPDGEHIATGCLYSADGMCPSRIWDAETGEPLQLLESPGGDTHFLAWSPDGTRFATAHVGGTATVWNATTGEAQLIFTGHDEWVADVAWSPDGTRIASGDVAGTVKGWNATTGSEVFSIQVPGGAVRIDWSPDGEHLVVAGEYDAPIIHRVWQSTEELLTYARDCCISRELTPEERTQFVLGDR